MATKPKDHTKTIDTIKKTVGELKKNLNKVTKGHEKMAVDKEKESSPEDHKAALNHFASQYKMAMMNKKEDKAKEYAKSYHEYAAKLDKHYHSKLKESVDICPECMEEPCACSGNHLGEEMNPYQDDEQIDEGTSAAVRMQRALNKVQDARKRQERLAAPYVKSVMGKKEEKKKEVSEASYNVRKDPTYQKYDPQTHTMMFKDGKHKVVKHDQVAKHKAQGYKVRSSVKAFIKGQAMSEAKADPTSSWVVHDGDKVKRFKTHEGAKAHAQKHGGKVASSAHYADKIQGKQGVAEASGTKPGWMLKRDPALAKKIADAKKLAKARKASYGDPSKGVSVNEAKSLSKMTVDELDKAHKENEAKIKAYTSNPTKALTKGHPLMTRRRSINLYKIIRAKQTNEEVEQVFEGYSEDDIANGGTVIYKHDGKHYMSKVSHKTGGGARTMIHTTSALGHVVPLHHVVSTDASDWNTFKNRPVKEEVEQVDELTNKALISYMSKVNDDIAKHKMDPSKRSAEKRNKSVSGFAKAYNKVQSNLKSVKEGSDVCNVCGQTPCNCTHVTEALKVGDIVKPNTGPHANLKHEVIHVHDDGAVNIKPVGLKASQIKYRQGAVKANPNQLVKEAFEDVQQVNELSNKKLIDYLQAVHKDSQKHKMDPTKRSAEKRNRSVAGFSKAFNKLEARPGTFMKESLADQMLALAKSKGLNAKLAPSAEDRKKATVKLIKHRAKEAAKAPPPPHREPYHDQSMSSPSAYYASKKPGQYTGD